MLFLDVGQAQAPSMPAFDSLFQSFQAHPVIGVIVTFAFILIFLVMFRFSDILNYFKEKNEKKQELELKKLEADEKKQDVEEKRWEGLKSVVSDSVEAIKNNTTAMNGIEKAILLSDAKMADLVADLSKDMLSMEGRISDKITATAKDAERGSKLDKIADRLRCSEGGGEDSDDGDHR